MTWRTHTLCGIASLWVLAPVPHGFSREVAAASVGPLAALAAFGALLPDLDAREARIKHLSPGWGIEPFVLPASFIHRAFGHRGLLHSGLGLGIFALLITLPATLWWGWQPPAALVLGYASHLAADACTRAGIPLLYPQRRRFFLLPTRLRFVTGSPAESALLPLLAVPVVLLLLRSLLA